MKHGMFRGLHQGCGESLCSRLFAERYRLGVMQRHVMRTMRVRRIRQRGRQER